MPRLRNALTVAAAGLALSLLGAGTAAAAPNTHCPPPDSECSDTGMDGCAGGLDVGGVLDLGGLLDGLLGGLVGGGGACCTAADPA